MFPSLRTLPKQSAESPDKKLRRLIDDPNETLDPATRKRIMAHIASAPFNKDRRTLREWQRIGPNYAGLPHPSVPGQVLDLTTDIGSADWHVTKHTGKGEWAPGTTTQEYLVDIQASVRHASSILDVGGQTIRYPGTSTTRYAPRAGVRTDMAQAAAVVKKAIIRPGWHMLTVYGVDTHVVTTAYQLESSKAMTTVSSWSNHRAFT